MTRALMARSRANAAAGLCLALLIGPAAMAAPTSISTELYPLKITTVASGLTVPWAFALLPDGKILITERAGSLRAVVGGKLLQEPVVGLPAVVARGQGGLLDIVAHPAYVENQLIYWTYSAGEGASIGTELARGKLSCTPERCRVDSVEVLFRQQPKVATAFHFGARLVWDRSGNLLMTLGDRGKQDEAQNRGNHIGTVIRLKDDGEVATNNPFVGVEGVKPEIFSFGHRNIQGAALHPQTGELWAHEHGPQGGDELNIVRRGLNYGWPVITFGRTYGRGEKIGEGTERSDIPAPLKVWLPTSIAPAGLAFYTGDRFPKWRDSIFLGSLRERQLLRLQLDGNRVVAEERIDGLGRIRDVRQGADGNLYVLSESEGALMRLAPTGS